MSAHPTTTVTTAGDGRLPTPTVDWPISRESFDRLATHWRRANVWLSLWNGQGRAVAFDAQGARWWTALWSHGAFFRQELGAFARAALEDGMSAQGQGGVARVIENPGAHQPGPVCRSTGKEGAGATNPRPDGATVASPLVGDVLYAESLDLGPWQPDVGLIAAPIQWRRRRVGVVLGTMLLSQRPGEAFARLCDRCGLDRQAMIAFASTAGALREDQAGTFARLLRFSVEQARDIEAEREETSILTRNLENTYEELNLVYKISAQMHLPQKPGEMCRRVAREVLEVSRATTVGFVLRPCGTGILPVDPPCGTGILPVDPPCGTGILPVDPALPLDDRVVCVGPGAPTLRDLDALAESLSTDIASGAGHLLLNEACSRPELQWAAGWLKHLVALPLWHEQQLLGVLFAVNCDDEGDFTSVDVQLFRAVADRVTAFLENQHLYDDVTDLLMGLLHALVNSIDAKDPYTSGHSERVAFISRALARKANLSPVDCERVYLAGLVHDVGKLGVPDAILCKPGKLTREEFDAMKKHPEIGAKILADVKQIADLVPGVLYHHERMDGRGYPHRLADKAIPLLGRIICLADCFDAMTTSRTYRAALPLPMTVAEIRRCSGTQFDPELAELFLSMDCERLLEEARQCSGVDRTIGQIGALNAAMTGSFAGCRAPPGERG